MTVPIDEDVAERFGQQWLNDPIGAQRLAEIRRWREQTTATELLEVLGQPPHGWTIGQDYALAQLVGHLRAGDVLLVQVDLVSAPRSADDPQDVHQRRAVPPRGCAMNTGVDGSRFVVFAAGFAAPVWPTLPGSPHSRALSTPAVIPLEVGPAAPSTVLGHLRTQTAVARWPHGHAVLSVLVTHPGGRMLRHRYPAELSLGV